MVTVISRLQKIRWRPRLRVASLALVASLTVLAAPTPAHASGGCDPGGWIEINTGAGAEAPSWVRGHKHLTGNHYVKQITSTGIIWWADNNGGSDGDTWDTFYADHYCNH